MYFLDSSAILKLYLAENGTAWVRSLLLPASGNRISVATICGVEIASAIARRAQGQTISPAEASQAIGEFRRDFTIGFELIEIDFPLIINAMDLAERHLLRGYDAVQLAAAIATDTAARTLGSTAMLVSADLELNAAAAAEGLPVEDPNNYP